ERLRPDGLVGVGAGHERDEAGAVPERDAVEGAALLAASEVVERGEVRVGGACMPDQLVHLVGRTEARVREVEVGEAHEGGAAQAVVRASAKASAQRSAQAPASSRS